MSQPLPKTPLWPSPDHTPPMKWRVCGAKGLCPIKANFSVLLLVSGIPQETSREPKPASRAYMGPFPRSILG